MSDKALVKVHFVPFVIILLLKLLCMKLFNRYKCDYPYTVQMPSPTSLYFLSGTALQTVVSVFISKQTKFRPLKD